MSSKKLITGFVLKLCIYHSKSNYMLLNNHSKIYQVSFALYQYFSA